MASRNPTILESSIEGIRTEIEDFFQQIIALIMERKRLLLQELDESVQLLGANFVALMNEHTELLSMRNQIEENLNKNSFSDLRVDMLGPLQARLRNQEDQIKYNFELAFYPTGFTQLVDSINHFGNVSNIIPVPPPNMPEANDYLNKRIIPLPPPDYPNPRTARHTMPTTRVFQQTFLVAHRNRYRIPPPPPDIPRALLYEYTLPVPVATYTRDTPTNSNARSSASNPRLRAFFSLLRDKK